ncbi:MAG TPA: crossover junction endodeoxyribonuclease RuvC [Candidatus Eisenbacteria bacterium]|nr:crossover junction endodeoxyribonuclease RuvC [Candidatus Eisenbacteria bacterium]
MTTSSGSSPTSTSRTRRSRASSPEPAIAPLILGIDPGSRATGYGFVRRDGSRIRYEHSGVITTRATLPFADRLLAIHEALAALLERWRPDEVAVETAFVRKSAHAALQIGHVRGVVLLAARQSGAALYEYTAPEVKMAVVRQGAAAKEQVAFMVRRLLPQAPQGAALREDEADALAVALCHAHRVPGLLGRLR